MIANLYLCPRWFHPFLRTIPLSAGCLAKRCGQFVSKHPVACDPNRQARKAERPRSFQMRQHLVTCGGEGGHFHSSYKYSDGLRPGRGEGKWLSLLALAHSLPAASCGFRVHPDRAPLPEKLQGELDLSSGVSAKNCAKDTRAGINRIIWIVKVHLVKDVKELRPELHLVPFLEGEVFEYGEVSVA